MSYKSNTQNKNIAWFLPRPKKDKYKGGMPLYCEEWLLELAKDILQQELIILNLFCGMNKYGYRVDIKEEVKPDLICDAHHISLHIKDKLFNVILADPPYSNEEALKLYNTPKLSYKKWTAECDKLLLENGILIVYHKLIMPNPNPEKYEVVKRVFIGNRPNHSPRVAVFYKKKII